MEQPDAMDIEIRFDSFTLKDLPESEQETLRDIFDASPMVSATRIKSQATEY
jgi:hypothetical protein